MISRAVIIDFSRVLLFPNDRNYTGSLNDLHKQLAISDAGYNYNFFNYFNLNEELLTFLANINRNTNSVYLFTSDSVQEHPAIADKVNAAVNTVFSARKLGIDKSDPRAFQKLTRLLKISPGQILYIDDQKISIRAARLAKLRTLLYENNSETAKTIEAFLLAKTSLR